MESSFESVLSSIQSGNAEHLLAWTTIESTIRDIENQPTLLKPEVHFQPKLIFDRTKLQELLDALKNEVSIIEDFTACAENTFARGGGLHLAFLGGQHSFAINAHDAQKRRRSLGSDLFMVELEDKFGNKQATGSYRGGRRWQIFCYLCCPRRCGDRLSHVERVLTWCSH